METKKSIIKNLTPSKAIGIVFTFIGVVFIVLALVVCLPQFNEVKRKTEILSVGNETVATVISYESAGLTINNVNYYYLVYEYLGDDGVKQDKSSPSYTEVEAVQAVIDRALTVYYTADGSVEKGFDEEIAKRPIKNILLTFGLIGLVFVMLGVGSKFFGRKSVATIENNGQETIGQVVGRKGGVFIMEEEYYSVKVSYMNARGEDVIGSTGHKLKKQEADEYPDGVEVNIKYYGKSVLILGKR